MYLFLFFGHLVSKLLDHSILPTIVLWTTSFGVEQAYANQTVMMGLGMSAILIPIVGYLSDKVGFQFQLVLMYGMRLVSVVSFFFLRSPNDWVARLTVIMMIVCSLGEQLVIYSMFTKRLPGDMRGAMRGIFYSFGFLGQLIISQISILIVNNGYTIASSFAVVASMDAFVLFLAIVMGLAGIFDEEEK